MSISATPAARAISAGEFRSRTGAERMKSRCLRGKTPAQKFRSIWLETSRSGAESGRNGVLSPGQVSPSRLDALDEDEPFPFSQGPHRLEAVGLERQGRVA